jgi:hypothetical protein
MDLNLIKMCNNCEVGDWRERWKVSMQETSVPNLHAGPYTIKTEMQSLSACAVSVSGNLKLNAGGDILFHFNPLQQFGSQEYCHDI